MCKIALFAFSSHLQSKCTEIANHGLISLRTVHQQSYRS